MIVKNVNFSCISFGYWNLVVRNVTWFRDADESQKAYQALKKCIQPDLFSKVFFGDGMNLAEDFFFLPPSFWRWIRDRLEEGKISFCQTKLKRSRDDQRLLLHRSLCGKQFFFEFNLVIIIALLLMFRSVNFKSIVQGRGK